MLHADLKSLDIYDLKQANPRLVHGSGRVVRAEPSLPLDT
jgi:hypothetical protein